MELGCLHVSGVQHDVVEALLKDPTTWVCEHCGTSESVWCCLYCGHRGCGREQEGHAHEHFQQNKRHPHHLTIDLSMKSVHCYSCDCYVFNDNQRSEIALIRQMLVSMETQQLEPSRTRSGRQIHSGSQIMRPPTANWDRVDRLRSALMQWRFHAMAKAWHKWREVTALSKSKEAIVPFMPELPRGRTGTAAPTNSFSLYFSLGLRNLGNTCFVNSVLQTLAQIPAFKEFFEGLVPGPASPSMLATPVGVPSGFSPRVPVNPSPGPRPPTLTRFSRLQRTTTEACLRDVSRQLPLMSQLRTGSRSATGRATRSSAQAPSGGAFDQVSSVSLELHRLFRVLWSGKWEVVTPHALMTALWKFVPMTRGYKQQDAQEFLDNLLERISSEVAPENTKVVSFIHQKLGGKLRSSVVCGRCNNASNTDEVTLGLQVDIPDGVTTLVECLESFTSWEDLGQDTYSCDRCAVKTSARKCIEISDAPEVLQLQLKRFCWTMRGPMKEMRHVSFPLVGLDLAPFVTARLRGQELIYDLLGVVEHHGKGWGGGHYTAFGRLVGKGTWHHYNDDRVTAVSPDDVAESQAYLLVYQRRDRRPVPQYVGEEADVHVDVAERLSKKKRKVSFAPPPPKRRRSARLH